MKMLTKPLDKWLRRRIRMCYWKQWKKSGPDIKIWSKEVWKIPKLGNLPTQEKATGE